MDTENNDIGNRIAQIISLYRENKNSFSKIIGLSNNTTIGRIIKENRTPSFEVLNKIALAFPDINYYWILTGQGEMINTNKGKLNDFEESEIIAYVYKNIDTFEENNLFKLFKENLILKEVKEEMAKREQAATKELIEFKNSLNQKK